MDAFFAGLHEGSIRQKFFMKGSNETSRVWSRFLYSSFLALSHYYNVDKNQPPKKTNVNLISTLESDTILYFNIIRFTTINLQKIRIDINLISTLESVTILHFLFMTIHKFLFIFHFFLGGGGGKVIYKEKGSKDQKIIIYKQNTWRSLESESLTHSLDKRELFNTR